MNRICGLYYDSDWKQINWSWPSVESFTAVKLFWNRILDVKLSASSKSDKWNQMLEYHYSAFFLMASGGQQENNLSNLIYWFMILIS